MSVHENGRLQAEVDRLIDDLRRLVEEERSDPVGADARHEQSERLRWTIANVVKSASNEDAVARTRAEQHGPRAASRG
jgi:hypothetical protein